MRWGTPRIARDPAPSTCWPSHPAKTGSRPRCAAWTRARRARFDVKTSGDLPRLQIVEDHLVMVLVNLLINALDSMPDGGEIQIRAETAGDYVRVSVKDSGVGMSEETRRRAIQPLFTTKGDGTGLGLSVSADVLKSAGGALDACQ